MKNQEYFGKQLISLDFAEMISMPELSMQTASLTPLEKSMIALLITAIKPKLIIETGVWRGLTTRFISEFANQNSLQFKIVGFDLPDIIDELLEIDFLKQSPNIQFVKGLLPESLTGWLTQSHPIIDFAIIDADHNYFSAYTELSAIEPYLAEDGYFFCHDYGIDQNNHEGVLCAVEDFCRQYGFTALPLQSRPSSPKTILSAQSVILRRRMVTPFSRKLSHIRKYMKRKYFTNSKLIKPYKLS